MTQQGQWVCCGPDRAFACNIAAGRVISFGNTPNGWNLTVELEAPGDANRKLQEVMDIMITGKTFKRNKQKVEQMRGLLRVIKQMWTGRRDATSVPPLQHFGVQGTDRLVRPNERSLEPFLGTDGEETMMDHHGNDDAGETSAVKSKIQPMKASDQEIATTHAAITHIAIGVVLVLVALDGQTLTDDSGTSRTVFPQQTWTVGSSLMAPFRRRGMTVETLMEPLRFWWWKSSGA